MKSLVILGAILVVLGILGLAIPVFSTSDTKDVAKLGDIKIQTQETQNHVIPPLASEGVIAVGALVLIIGAVRKS